MVKRTKGVKWQRGEQARDKAQKRGATTCNTCWLQRCQVPPIHGIMMHLIFSRLIETQPNFILDWEFQQAQTLAWQQAVSLLLTYYLILFLLYQVCFCTWKCGWSHLSAQSLFFFFF
jgi:hypothetical protein